MTSMTGVTITPTRVELSARCFRRHAVADLLSLRPRDDSAPHRDFGSAMHAAAAAYWKARFSGIADPETLATQALEDTWLTSIEDNEKKLSLELARFMVRHYCAAAQPAGTHWAADATWELVVCEERILLDLGDGVTLSFQLDRLVRCTQGDAAQPIYVLVDTKTASRLGAYWHRQWPTSLQQKLYHRAVELYYGIDLAAHYVEGVLKSAPSEIAYHEVQWADSVLDEAVELAKTMGLRDLDLLSRAAPHTPQTLEELGQHRSIRSLRELVVTDTLTNPSDCFAYNRKCELFELCHETSVDQREALLNLEFEEVAQDWLE